MKGSLSKERCREIKDLLSQKKEKKAKLTEVKNEIKKLNLKDDSEKIEELGKKKGNLKEKIAHIKSETKKLRGEVIDFWNKNPHKRKNYEKRRVSPIKKKHLLEKQIQRSKKQYRRRKK